MITRMWRGWTRSGEADRYEQHYRSEVVVTLGQVSGFRGARLLRRTIGEREAALSRRRRTDRRAETAQSLEVLRAGDVIRVPRAD